MRQNDAVKFILYALGFTTFLAAFYFLLNQLHPIFSLLVGIGILGIALYTAYINWGGILLSMGKVDEAQRLLDRKIQRNPRNALAHVQRAGLKFSLGDADGALADYDAALQLDIARLERWAINKGIEATIHTERGQVYFEQKNYPQALEALEEAQKLKSNFHPTLAWLAITHYALTNFEEADRLWKTACKYYPRYAVLDGTNWIKNQPGWVEREIDEAKKIAAFLNANN